MSVFVKTLIIVSMVILGSYGTFILFDVGSWLFTNHVQYYNVMSGTGTMFLALAAFYTAVIGLKQFQLQKKTIADDIRAANRGDEQRKYRFELASRVIDAAHNAQMKLEEIRSPALPPAEREQVLNQLIENEGEDAANEIINNTLRAQAAAGFFRWNENREAYFELKQLQKKFEFVFGDSTSIEEILEQWRSVRAAAISLANGREIEGIEWRIWHVGDENDQVHVAVQNAVTNIENICGPILGKNF